MIDLGFINVAGAVVGQTFTFDWSAARIEPTLKQQGMNISDTLALYNESGVGFMVTMNQTSRTFTLPAGGWALDLPCTVPGGVDLNLTMTVEYILPSPAVSQVHADYFGPGENPLGASVVLGNSPINGSVSAIVASTLVNVGNSAGTNIINASPASTGGNIQVFNDGSRIVHLLDTGISTVYESLQNGSGLATPTVIYGSASSLAATTFNGTGNFGNTTIGTLVSAGGVATVGQWVSIAHQPGITISTNGLTTILNIASAPTRGFYRVSATVTKGNVTASALTFQVTYTDHTFGAQTIFLSSNSGGAFINFRGTTTVTNGVFPTFVTPFPSEVATAITLSYNDPTGTPNDVIQADIEVFVV